MKTKKILLLIIFGYLISLVGCKNNSHSSNDNNTTEHVTRPEKPKETTTTYFFQNAFVTVKWADEYVKNHSEELAMLSNEFGEMISDGSETEFLLSNDEIEYYQNYILRKEEKVLTLSDSSLNKTLYNITSVSDNVYSLDGQPLALFFWGNATTLINEMYGKDNNNQFNLIQKTIVNAEIKEVEYTYVFVKEKVV